MTRRTAAWLAPALVLALGACATTSQEDVFDRAQPLASIDERAAGEALAQQKRQMRRTQRDLGHFRTTLESLRRHQRSDEIAQFEAFVRPYMAEQVDPLLSTEIDSWQPELVTLDANLIFAKAAVLVELRDRRALDRLIRDVTKRFSGVEGLFVEYPIGTRSTLEEAIATLRTDRFHL